MESPTSSPCVYTPPDALGTSTGDSMSILPHTICADTPRPSETGNMSTSVDSAGNVTQQNDPIVDHLLTLSNLTASIISQSQNLSPWQVAALKESASAMLSAVGGESKNKPVDLATSPPSSDQDKSSWVNGPKCPDPTIQDTGRKILLEPHGENILSCSMSGGQLNEALLKRTKAALSAICLAPFTFTEGNIINYEATNKKDLITSLNEAGNGAHFKDKGFIFSFNACDLNNRDGMLRIAGTLSEFVIARLKLYPDIFFQVLGQQQEYFSALHYRVENKVSPRDFLFLWEYDLVELVENLQEGLERLLHLGHQIFHFLVLASLVGHKEYWP